MVINKLKELKEIIDGILELIEGEAE